MFPRRLRLVRARLQERRRDDELAGGDDAAGLQHPHHLCQRRLSIRDVHEHRVAVGDVEVAVVEGQRGHVADVERRVVVAASSI